MRLSTMKMAFCCWVFCCYGETRAAMLPSTSDDPRDRRLSEGVSPGGEGGQGHHADVDVRHGVLFQTNGCPQAITSEEARDIAANTPFSGNTIKVTSQTRGRTGNRFEVLSQSFSMAYCCRSNLLELPEHDREVPHDDGSRRWVSRNQWYDFSDANMDLLPEFADLSNRPDVCLPSRVESGPSAFSLVGVHPDLLRCLNRVFVRGCEAEVMSSVADMDSFCHPKDDKNATITTDGNHQQPPKSLRRDSRHLRSSPALASKGTHDLQSPAALHLEATREFQSSTTALGRKDSRDLRPSAALDPEPQVSGTGGDRNAGSLVIHIRSGDIFNAQGQGKTHPEYGQPPLKFFLKAIAHKAWSDVAILTSAMYPRFMNPTYTALGMLNGMGLLGPNVVLHNKRPLLEDMRAMLCADALAVARSTLHFLTFAHTRASTLYVPDSCGPGRSSRRSRIPSDVLPLPTRNPDNTTLLLIEKPGAEVYGIEWEKNRDAYSPYQHWMDTDAQLLEMVTFDGIKGMKRCSITD